MLNVYIKNDHKWHPVVPVVKASDIPQCRRDKWSHPFLCDRCDKRFFSSQHLIQHKRSIHTTQLEKLRFRCAKCNCGFKHQYNLNAHMKTHMSDKFYECTICGRSFIRRSNLRSHFFTHAKRVLFGCRICDKIFSRKRNLDRHYKLVHRKIKVD